MSNLLIPADDAYELKVANQRPWFSPVRVLVHYIRLLKKVGMQEIERAGRYQKVREMKAVALLLLGIRKNQPLDFWMQAVLEEPTPDVLTFCFGRDSKGGTEQWVQSVEVVTYNEQENKPLDEFIWKTKYSKRKSYPPHYVVLCELRKTFLRPPLPVLHFQLGKYKPTGTVMILGRLSPTEEIYQIAQIYPELELIEDFDAGVEARKIHTSISGQGRHHTIQLQRVGKTTELTFRKIPGKAPGPFEEFLREDY